MIRELFDLLYKSLYAAPLIALLGSFVWGILSILLSPCHLASIPLIIGFIDEQGKISTKRAFWISLLFSNGILVTIGLIGVITGLLGRMLGDIGRFGNYFVAVIFLIIGLHLLEIIQLPFLGSAKQPGMKKKGFLAAFLIGLIFGIASGPCTFAYMAPMLGVVFSVASKNIIFAVSLVLAYAVGHCSVIVFAGTFTEIVQKYLNWSERSKGTVILKKVCGILVILAGIYMFFNK
ncbi:MAG: cytochrome C biogenesis protein [Elusimicrobia bacterium]|nr:cytochrome C biogenesis protein [Elusimicrobiota bacterium]